MAWSQSGLYAAVLNLNLAGTTGPDWDVSTNKMFLTNNSDAPAYDQAAASAIYAVTNEVSGSGGWPAGGVAASGLASGGGNISLALTVTSAPATAKYGASNVSVANTNLTNARGGYFYWDGATKYKIIGIYFGGSDYTTVAGTFAITWSSGTICTIQCAAS